MSGLFGKPKVSGNGPQVDPAQTENRKAEARLRRLREGGAASTIMSDGMAALSGASPRATLTGMS